MPIILFTNGEVAIEDANGKIELKTLDALH